MTELSEKDLRQIAEKNITQKQIEKQIRIFREGIPFIRLEKAAIVSEGILRCSPAEETRYIKNFEDRSSRLEILKFVPASGAASRMFKALFNFLEEFDPDSGNDDRTAQTTVNP